ncbi:hypothetical protein CONCODRAFT_6097 [Conidiobolus coronatus NRRL 28638]|uniref:G-protein coupled receptors family 1 profile domain-containing protein n=1 Tax=Conidiobolus coronatus (strain ATCC 28846 / CBS 209.66 / NRRL 28638) TaxID=796925 RepID=A0A137P882_CONC2|nr:hypothetical protein CONCODRAFT_6097 [Conidiobolus coronatus NRRL 28638]|eukprot:KXN71210.1 hypothetical protein CONCODRAFT_6097 [Conidiobolus coronatus NRRL 28638]
MGLDDSTLINYVFNSIGLIGTILIFIFNSVLILIILIKCDSRSPDNRLILILCVIKVIDGIEYTILYMAKLIIGYEWFSASNLQCKIYTFITQSSPRIEITTVMVISIVRYVFVYYGIKKRLLFWILILALSISPALVIFLYGAISGDVKPTSSYLQRVPYTLPGLLTTVITSIIPFLFLIPCWTITFCYFGIGYKVNKELNKLIKEAKSTNNQPLIVNIKKQKTMLFIQLIAVFILYNLNYLASYITHMLKFIIGYKRPPFIDALIFTAGRTTCVFNSIITISFQPEINNEFKLILIKSKLQLKGIFNRFRNIQ